MAVPQSKLERSLGASNTPKTRPSLDLSRQDHKGGLVTPQRVRKTSIVPQLFALGYHG